MRPELIDAYIEACVRAGQKWDADHREYREAYVEFDPDVRRARANLVPEEE